MSKYRFSKEDHLHELSRDGKLFLALTGTSSVVGVLSKPLSYWAAGKAVEVFGWLNPKKFTKEEVEKKAGEGLVEVKGLSAKGYLKLLDKAYRNHATSLKDSAQAGTDLHAELEKFVKSEMGKNKEKNFDPKIKPYIDWSRKNVKKYLASEAHTYSEVYWLGGIVDAVAEMNDGRITVIDFKSSKEAYASQFIQAALYKLQIEENGIFSEDGNHSKKIEKPIEQLIIVPFGAEVVVPEVREFLAVDEFVKGGKAALILYKLLGLDKVIKENN